MNSIGASFLIGVIALQQSSHSPSRSRSNDIVPLGPGETWRLHRESCDALDQMIMTNPRLFNELSPRYFRSIVGEYVEHYKKMAIVVGGWQRTLDDYRAFLRNEEFTTEYLLATQETREAMLAQQHQALVQMWMRRWILTRIAGRRTAESCDRQLKKEYGVDVARMSEFPFINASDLIRD